MWWASRMVERGSSPPTGSLVGSSGLKRLSSEFTSTVRSRGQHYLADERVEVIEASANVLAAEVAGNSARYLALFIGRNSELRYSCTCPHFEREQTGCKHLWAVALEGAETALMQGTLARCSRLIADPGLTWDGDGEDDADAGDDDDEIDDDTFIQTYGPQSFDLAPHHPVAKQTGIGWQELERSVTRRSDFGTRDEVRYFLAEEFDGSWSVVIGKRKQGAELGPLTPVGMPSQLRTPTGIDRELTGLIQTLRERDFYSGGASYVRITTTALELLLPRLTASGRCHLLPRAPTGELGRAWRMFGAGLAFNKEAVKALPSSYSVLLEAPTLVVDNSGPWELELKLEEPEVSKNQRRQHEYEAHPTLVRAEERRLVAQLRLAQADGSLVFADGTVSSCDAEDARWLRSLQEFADGGCVLVPAPQLAAFLELGFGPNGVSRIVLPSGFERVAGIPARPILELEAPRGRTTAGRVFFEYGETRVSVQQKSALVLLSDAKALERDRQTEDAALDTLRDAGFDGAVLGGRNASGGDVKIAAIALLPALRTVLEAGFQVFAQGKRYRSLSSFDIQIESGLDWFEVQGAAHFGDVPIALPQLLRQARIGNGAIELGDGTRGVLPSTWLERWGGLSELTPRRDAPLRFSTRQLGIAEVILEALGEEVSLPGLSELRQRVDSFYQVTPRQPPASFRGSLRPYQAHGLSWLGALSELKLGACLADDMGLGKTIQVLAHFARQYARTPRARSQRRAPSLIVMPRSLLANWSAEAARFAPELRVHTHWGPERGDVEQAFHDVDLVFTTYGTLRLDIVALSQLDLSTVVLDEAQAIKNGASATAKCARKLRAAHRIALSGTPIENHLGELWSLFEFLNPGMLAELPSLGRALDKGQASPETLKLIQLVLRPFVLRRTKQEVAKDLPERSEQTLFVDLEPDERAHYDHLLKFYQASIKKQGLTDPTHSTPHVLEALLRLRQAACHPGLIDQDRAGERSSKIELLLQQLRGLVTEGHKALVFSQFTSLLSILRERLDEEKISFEYLDGKTRDRAAAVARFQNDPELSVFLVSLKAGGVGLNLTAADYVFILDPWWNPAVEAQAIDRAHRIGQTRPVIAYRLLARNTVEERVAQLQDQKRQLVAAVMGDADAFTGKLTRGDLESLLGLGTR